jgi:hypothetical protein
MFRLTMFRLKMFRLKMLMQASLGQLPWSWQLAIKGGLTGIAFTVSSYPVEGGTITVNLMDDLH